MKKFALTLLLLCFTVSCTDKTITDYTDANNWLASPQKITKPVDVFYLYPTIWFTKKTPDQTFASINNKEMRENAPIIFKMQASLFEPNANIFAPYYRQADALKILALPFEERDEMLTPVTEKDVLAAFDYYIKNNNQGRPFILAGHSQGAMMVKPLLFKYMKEHPEVYKRMVAAYLFGYAVTQEELANNPHVKFAEKADDTGVIISYNTESPDLKEENFLLGKNNVVINPISWRRDDKLASEDENLDSVFIDHSGKATIKPHYANAQLDLKRGVVLCSTKSCDETEVVSKLFPKGIYHMEDIPFYYESLRKNAKDRTEAYLRKQENK